MLSLDAKRSARNYANVNGMYNGAWITGYVRNIDRDKGTFFLQQTNNQARMLPIHCDGNTRLPASVRETHPLHVIAHAEGFMDNDKKERGVKMRAIGFERPSIMTVSADAAWNAILKPGISPDEFKPVQGLSGRMNASSNVVKLAGFLQGMVMTRDENPVLIILIRQHEDANRAVPVRITGRFVKPLKERLQIGMPIYVEGQYAIKVTERPEQRKGDSEIMPVEKIPYIHASNIRAATHEEITVVPQWAREVREQITKATVPSEGKRKSRSPEKTEPATAGAGTGIDDM